MRYTDSSTFREDIMKTKPVLFLLLASFASQLYEGCDNPQSPSLTMDSDKDTLFTIVVKTEIRQSSASLYRYISRKDLWSTDLYVFDTVYTKEAPPSTRQIPFAEWCTEELIISITRILPANYDTLYRFIDNPAISDTEFITYNFFKSIATYEDTIDCRIDSIEAYLRDTKPCFVRKDSMAGILSTATEGYLQYIHLPVLHFRDDSAAVYLINNPPWIMLYRMSLNEGYSSCWSYPLCKNGVREESVCLNWTATKVGMADNCYDCFKPHILFNADSMALDSVYNWQIVVNNKYGLSDTMAVSTEVVPFPDSLRCR